MIEVLEWSCRLKVLSRKLAVDEDGLSVAEVLDASVFGGET